MAIVAVVFASVLGTFSALLGLLFGAAFSQAVLIYVLVSATTATTLIIIGVRRRSFSAAIRRSAENACSNCPDLRYGGCY